ncbi:MAG TPA: DUF2203 domain-containing protein [Planctomycetota bacterium]|nr:DUF2203 domain-containing protein [Planctomycetota bacterium]
MTSRLFTVDSVNRLLPQLERHLAAAREAGSDLQFVAEQVQDLEALWGSAIEDSEGRDREEYVALTRRLVARQEEFHQAVGAIHALGGVLKDVANGLVDFPTERGDSFVYLCWKAGEAEVTHFHSLGSGFGARRPVAELAHHG